MKRFRFSLQSVTTIRTWRESQAREAFAQSLNALKQAEDALAAVRRRVSELEVLLRHGQAATFRPAEHAAAVVAYQRELTSVQQAEQRRQAAQSAVDLARTAWQETRNQLRVVGQLEHRARQLHRLSEERSEQGLLDEIASIRASRLSPLRS